MEKLSFYDVKAKKKFTTDKYEVKVKKVKGRSRKFAVAKSPISGVMAWRIM